MAKASLTELKTDYASFLRQNKLAQWGSDDPVRQELVDRRFTDADAVALWGREVHIRFPERSFAEIAGNIGFIYANVAFALSDRQLQSQGKEFEENSGFNEHLYKVRIAARQKENDRKE